MPARRHDDTCCLCAEHEALALAAVEELGRLLKSPDDRIRFRVCLAILGAMGITPEDDGGHLDTGTPGVEP